MLLLLISYLRLCYFMILWFDLAAVSLTLGSTHYLSRYLSYSRHFPPGNNKKFIFPGQGCLLGSAVAYVCLCEGFDETLILTSPLFFQTLMNVRQTLITVTPPRSASTRQVATPVPAPRDSGSLVDSVRVRQTLLAQHCQNNPFFSASSVSHTGPLTSHCS